MRKDRAREMRCAALLAAQTATDTQAVSMPSLYPEWVPDTPYGGEGNPRIVRRPESKLYRIRAGQAHVSQAGWEPENTPAMWEYIDVEHAGTMADPIPAVRGMEYQHGLHYLDTEDGKVYLCQRAGEAEGGKVVLQYLPHELVGQYFEEVAQK